MNTPLGSGSWNWKSLCEEPYRILFPLGLLAAVFGLGVWVPYYFWPGTFPYPGQGHAIMQIQGFLYAFILGFLCTMLPKVLGVAPLNLWQLQVFFVGILGTSVAAILGYDGTSQVLHLLLILNFLAFILSRLPKRKTNPPSFFVFIALAMLADTAGTLLRLMVLNGRMEYASKVDVLLQYQAFPLLLIMGVGSFLLPKLLEGAHLNPRSLAAQSETSWFTLLILGLIFVLSYGTVYWFTYPFSMRLGYGIRAVIWCGFLFSRLRLQRRSPSLPAYLIGSRISSCIIGAGLALPVFFPEYLLAWEHLIFITGYLWLTLSIATRVVSAHGGRLDLLGSHRRLTLGYGVLLVVAAATRVSTDIWPGAHNLHLAVASALALCALVIWTRIHSHLLFIFPSHGN